MPIYKILLPAEWAEFETQGRFDGSPLDRRSGFVHCSARDQVAATARRFFADQPALVVVALDERALGDAVRWEAAPDGGVYPHVYASLPRGAVLAMHQVAGATVVDRQLLAE
jgi:uncharacterized protein (DUF952 family)